MYGRQSLQLQLLGSHFLTFSLKLSIETEFLIPNGIICHAIEAKHLIEFSPYWLVLALLLMKSVCDLKLELIDRV